MTSHVKGESETAKSAIITVTYNKVPSLRNFEKASELVDYVIICDNSSDPFVIGYLERFCSSHPKFVLLKNNENLGISKAYNKSVAFAQTLGVFWLYFFDDDANFDVDWIRKAKSCWRELTLQEVPVGVLAPIITNDEGYFNSTLGFTDRYSIISSVITSGVFTNVEVFNHCGGYNPDFFVDWADLEFSRRVKESGYVAVRLNEVLIFQPFGRNLKNCSLRNRLVNGYIKSTAMVSLKLNKSNTLSTFYSLYSPARYQDQKENALWSMKHSGIKNLGFRLVLILIHHLVLPKILRKEILYPYQR